MSQSSVHDIEQELEIKLSPYCIDYFANFPFAPDSFVVWAGLVFEPHNVIQNTNWNRANGFFGQSWPHNYLVIGSDGLGNEFFLDATNEHSPVLLADHERCSNATTLIFDHSDDTLALWIEAMHLTEETTPDWLKAQARE